MGHIAHVWLCTKHILQCFERKRERKGERDLFDDLSIYCVWSFWECTNQGPSLYFLTELHLFQCSMCSKPSIITMLVQKKILISFYLVLYYFSTKLNAMQCRLTVKCLFMLVVKYASNNTDGCLIRGCIIYHC